MKPEVDYLRQLNHTTSVKSMLVLQNFTDVAPGVMDFLFNPFYSVFDIGTIEPIVPLDNSTICMMAAFNFEELEKRGVPTHYMGLVDQKGNVMKVADAVKAKTPLSTMRVRMVKRFNPTFVEEGKWNGRKWDYSVFENPPTNNFILPGEFISREILGKNSSVWKRIKKGKTSFAELGIPEDYEPGTPLPDTVCDYSTKFEPKDDYPGRPQMAFILGYKGDESPIDAIDVSTKTTNRFLTVRARETLGATREDGKVEFVTYVLDGRTYIALGDMAGTWHEDRYVLDGMAISKQLLRDEEKKINPEWVAEISRAKDEAEEKEIPDFHDCLDARIVAAKKDISPEFIHAFNGLMRSSTNVYLEQELYADAKPLGQAMADMKRLVG